METQNQGREDRPAPQHPEEINASDPAKVLRSQDKIDIKQSEQGREVSQLPADEHIEDRISQIDDQTRTMRENKLNDQGHDRPESSAGYMNDKSAADRDTGNARDGGWEESRTARHK